MKDGKAGHIKHQLNRSYLSSVEKSGRAKGRERGDNQKSSPMDYSGAWL